jgi:hypothetical protein
MLWGRSAGRCAFPECPNLCVDTFEQAGTILVGEMAHVIAHSENGPRAVPSREGISSYDNLVLLCPYHHTIIDKAPHDFPEEILRTWKTALELRVSKALDLPSFTNKRQLFGYAAKIMAENRAIHAHFGPCSPIARRNPLSNVAEVWRAKKTERIVPNNAVVVAAFERFRDLLTQDELAVFERFRVHAIAFEMSSVERLDGAPKFPADFGALLEISED